jgi:hypothetical protein
MPRHLLWCAFDRGEFASAKADATVLALPSAVPAIWNNSGFRGLDGSGGTPEFAS